MATFVVIQYGENEELLMNPNCRQMIFMGYLREKCQYDKKAFIDLLNENGKLANIHRVESQENVRDIFEDRLTYLPVIIEKGAEERSTLKRVKPLLTDWEKKFPQLERKIKILTGELKRKKSPLKGTLEPRGGRNVDRKGSSRDRSDMPGRSSSNMSRHSILNQSGRMSTTNAGKQSGRDSSRKSVSGKADRQEGLKTPARKGKKK